MTTTIPNAPAVSNNFGLRRCLIRAVWMALIWLGLNGLDAKSWVVGGPVVLTASWISLRMLPAISWRWSLRGALHFTVYFLRESVRGGWDVARRAVSTGLTLSPALVRHPFHLPSGPSRLFFCAAVSLLPGTAVVAIEDSSVCIHVLDHSNSVEKELQELERRVGALFSLELIKDKEGVA